jgi:hypothetical protein
MHRLVRALGRLVHRRGGLLFSQNGEDVISPSLAQYDGWNREDVSWTYDFERRGYVRIPRREREAAQAALTRFARRGLLATATDYTRAGKQRAEEQSVANACAVGALPFVSNIALTRIPRVALTCPAH